VESTSSRCRRATITSCSDGLSDMIEDEDIHLTISTFSANLDTVAKQLIQLSNDNGGGMKHFGHHGSRNRAVSRASAYI